VFENIHRIDDEYDEDSLRKKYVKYLESDDKIIAYGGGISRPRKTYELIRSVAKTKGVRAIIAGAKPEGLDEYNRLINELHAEDKVEYIGFVPRSEWRYVLKIADISFVAFEKNCWNNIYCASGKAFESLFEGTPVLCSENPPLQRLCQEKKGGIATDNISDGIRLMIKDIDAFKNNALAYAKTLDYDLRISALSDQIIGAYDGKEKDLVY
jgi:glycosyltransferase involved in cell wall biosynthesis